VPVKEMPSISASRESFLDPIQKKINLHCFVIQSFTKKGKKEADPGLRLTGNVMTANRFKFKTDPRRMPYQVLDGIQKERSSH
jgi:hypothetical protein